MLLGYQKGLWMNWRLTYEVLVWKCHNGIAEFKKCHIWGPFKLEVLIDVFRNVKGIHSNLEILIIGLGCKSMIVELIRSSDGPLCNGMFVLRTPLIRFVVLEL